MTRSPHRIRIMGSEVWGGWPIGLSTSATGVADLRGTTNRPTVWPRTHQGSDPHTWILLAHWDSAAIRKIGPELPAPCGPHLPLQTGRSPAGRANPQLRTPRARCSNRAKRTRPDQKSQKPIRRHILHGTKPFHSHDFTAVNDHVVVSAAPALVRVLARMRMIRPHLKTAGFAYGVHD